MSDTEAIKRMLLAALTLAHISTRSVKEELRRGELILIEVDDLGIVRPRCMV